MILVTPVTTCGLTEAGDELDGVYFILVVVPVVIPFRSCVVALAELISGIGLAKAEAKCVLMDINLYVPLTMCVVRKFMGGIPVSLRRYTYVSNTNGVHACFDVMLPLLGPVLAAIIILSTLTA